MTTTAKFKTTVSKADFDALKNRIVTQKSGLQYITLSNAIAFCSANGYDTTKQGCGIWIDTDFDVLCVSYRRNVYKFDIVRTEKRTVFVDGEYVTIERIIF